MKAELSISFNIWNKSSILYPDNDCVLANVKYHDIFFQQYIYKHNDFISNTIRKNHLWYDCDFIYKIISKYAINRTDDMFSLDVGANIGSCSLLLLAMNISTISFEPLPKNLHLFTRSLLHNSKFLPFITLYPIAVGNKNSFLEISFHKDNMGASSATEFNKFFGKGTSVKVPSKPLDSILNNFSSPIIFAKIDVEGFEPYVIEGAQNFLKNHQIKMIFYEKTCLIKSENKDYFNIINNLFIKYNYTTSNSSCRHKNDQFNVLAIANSYILDNNIDVKELRESRF